MKILAAIDIMDGKVVRLTKGQESNKIIYSDDPLYVAKKWTAEGADMLHLVDLDAALGTGRVNTVLDRGDCKIYKYSCSGRRWIKIRGNNS